MPPGRKVPETRYRDGFEVATKARQEVGETEKAAGEMKWGQARRRAKREREAAHKKSGV